MASNMPQISSFDTFTNLSIQLQEIQMSQLLLCTKNCTLQFF